MFVKEMIYGTVIVIVSVVSGDSMRDFWLSEKNDWLSWWMNSANLERLDRRAIQFVDQILSRIDNIRKKIMIPPEGLISNSDTQLLLWWRYSTQLVEWLIG